MTLESLLSAAPPGQLDGLIKDLSSLKTTVPPELAEKVKKAASPSDEVCSHALAEPLAREFKTHEEAYYANVDYSVSIQQGGDSQQLTLTTYAERIDTKNCHAASWRGVWTINVAAAATTLSGSIHIHAYCHEDCNVQMETTKSYESMAIQGTDLAKSIRNKIATLESDVAAELEEMYDSMDDKLRALRRVLPVMRTRLEWNVLSHRMAKKLEETAGSH